ncbi:MAG: hypothetical protein WA902_04420 [Thermosynechococcaceae cyanobacterium]
MRTELKAYLYSVSPNGAIPMLEFLMTQLLSFWAISCAFGYYLLREENLN